MVHAVALHRRDQRVRVGLVHELRRVHADDDQLLGVLLLERPQLLQDVQAVDAAEGPEVEKHEAAAQLGDRVRRAAGVEPASAAELGGTDLGCHRTIVRRSRPVQLHGVRRTSCRRNERSLPRTAPPRLIRIADGGFAHSVGNRPQCLGSGAMDAHVDDREELAGYVEIWWQAVNDFLDLLEHVPEEEWTTPTDLAGWDVRACAAHTAHLEGILAGGPEETADVGEPPHVNGFMGLYTEIGVVNRRDASADALINEIRGDHDPAAHRAAGRPADRRQRQARAHLRRRAVDLAGAAAQPAAGHLDARAGRTPRGRPARRHGHRAGPAHRRVPRREPRLRARQEGRRAHRHQPGAGDGGQRAVRLRRSTRTAAASGSPSHRATRR